MPRPAKPWKRTQNDSYYCMLDGRMVRLTEPGESYKKALAEFHRLKAQPESSTKKPQNGPLTVAQIIHDFLDVVRTESL